MIRQAVRARERYTACATLAFNQGLEEALTDRSKLIKANGMGLDDIIAAKKLVRAFKPNK